MDYDYCFALVHYHLNTTFYLYNAYYMLPDFRVLESLGWAGE
jgi:hypothetical protein